MWGAIFSGVAALVGAGVSAYSAYTASEAQDDAASEARKIANLNAERAEAEAAESARRLKDQQDQNMALARARAHASGVKVSGTQKSYLDKMREEFSTEMSWLKKSGANAAEIERRKGVYESQMASASATSTRYGGFSTSLALLGKGASEAQNWWQTGGKVD